MATQRLSKALAHAGIASRRAAEELIFEGLVTVNGKITLVPQTMVDVAKDVVMYNGKRVRPESKQYFILHKPVGYICTNAPGKKRAIDLIGSVNARLYTVGRLDRDTSGLIILTNDGEFANSVMHPSKKIPKEYLVKVDKEVQHEHLVTMSEGMWVEGAFVKPLSVSKVRRGTLKVIICDGRKREVRRLVEKAGLETVSLTRIRIGGLVLGKLPVGHFRELSERERELLTST
ncbi:MAG: rRNA pseudouridine synthase [Verrucomicrobia bacterium]|nr:rRNA pseudouridine synthase [Verrucomicrobiota bacterium]MBS0637457.1 rRNA pseudouridine synthase [Verrucomicrobiota bacterium]